MANGIFIADYECVDLEQVLEEVKRGLREGYQVYAGRHTSAAPFIVVFYEERIPVRGFNKYQTVAPWTGR